MKMNTHRALFMVSASLLGAVLFSCARGKEVHQESGQPTASPPAPAVAEPAAREPESDAQRCARLVREYQAVRDGSPGACETDGDCVILPGGVDDCGRALDKTTAELLEPLYRSFRDRCGLTRRCAPRAAVPYCRGGRCVEGSPPGTGAVPRPPRPR
jgi:hypothetical protein